MNWPRVRPTPTNGHGKPSRVSSARVGLVRWCSCAVRPRRSIWLRKAGAARISDRATRSSSVGSNITRTSCPGSSCAWKRVRSSGVIPVDDSGQILLSEYRKLLNSKTKLVAFTQVSMHSARHARPRTSLNWPSAPVSRSCSTARSRSRIKVDVQALDCDWLVFSGHKIYGPTRNRRPASRKCSEAMQPWQGGGNMIEDVTFEKTMFRPAPARFKPARLTSPMRWVSVRRWSISKRSRPPVMSMNCWLTRPIGLKDSRFAADAARARKDQRAFFRAERA